MNSVNIEIWSDIACPWCWVGKRSLEAAIASSDHKVAIRWRAFELNPDAPANAPEAVDYVARLADKYGTSRDEAEGFIARMVGNSRTGMTGNSRTGIESIGVLRNQRGCAEKPVRQSSDDLACWEFANRHTLILARSPLAISLTEKD